MQLRSMSIRCVRFGRAFIAVVERVEAMIMMIVSVLVRLGSARRFSHIGVRHCVSHWIQCPIHRKYDAKYGCKPNAHYMPLSRKLLTWQ